jgi:methionyl-tRNA synthetase
LDLDKLYNYSKMEPIKFQDWSKLDLRVGEIMEIETIPGSDKLYKLKIDLGTETRTLVAGLRKHYTKEELENKRCIVFTNLEPKTFKGIQSQGMILASVNADESEVKLLQPDGEIELGSKVC